MDTSRMIFCFGSNTGGIHGAGAARFALQERGARIGIGYGLMGQSYAIPTKGVIRYSVRGQRKMKVGDTLSLHTIQNYVNDFLKFAERRSDLDFQVTCIGCGLAGLKHEDIAPMFAQASDNCHFDSLWQPIFDEQYFGKKFSYWGTF